MGEVSIGPTVTQYTLKPSQGIKLSQIVALHNDLSLALAAHPLRIEAPIPGKSWAGIEVPNKNPHLVKLRNLLEDPRYCKRKNCLTIPLGRNVAGEAIYDNLARMPHLLIAGATGTGKSVAIHNILISFLYQNSPRTLKLILIDPKRVELTAYNGIPHLLTPVIVDAQKAINSLKWAISEMERRYELLSNIGARDILSYNEKVSKLTKKQKENNGDNHKILPFIVIIIDELADIMMSYGRETEAAVVRLAQMARAVGIHLILSTQRPSVEVITGLIKANITFRIAFQVASQIDSRTIIDMAGAEKLLGSGDMLYQTGDSSKPKRIQGALILEREIKKIVDFLKKQDYEEERQIDLAIDGDNERINIDSFKDYEFEDELYADAKKIILESRKASASFLQRRMRIGYARAARILDMLERNGIIGPPRGSKPREILIKKEENAF
jgi:S-DNA-T family DNA segregation ATPase FtsK/SpoIIIE